MAEIVDVIHNLQYNITGNGLQQAATGVRQQLSLLQIQGEQMMRLQRLYDSTNASETAKRQRLLQLMERQRQAINQQAAATERQILTDRRLQQGMEREIGIIGTLQLKLDLLQKARTRATSESAIRDYDRQIRQLESRMARLNGQGSANGFGSQIMQGLGIGGGIGIANLIGSTLGKVKEFAKESFQAAANMESLTAAFNTLLGSRDKASALLTDLQKFAQETPFEFNQLTELSKQLLAFGYAGDEIIPTLRILGDVAGGVGADKLPNIVYAMGQIRAAGKLTGQDLLQLINAGFNPLQVISEKTGKSITQLKKDMEKGLITFKDVEGAFRTATSQGGKFFNLMQSQSKTTAGALSNFGDAVDQLKVAIGQTATGPVKDFVEGLAGMVNAWRDYISLSPAEKLQEERIELNAMVAAIISVKDNQAVRNQLVADLSAKYPDFLAGLRLETDLAGTLSERLKIVNEQYDARINKLQAVALQEANQKLFTSSISKQADATFVAAQLAQAAGLDISKVNSADPAVLRKMLSGFIDNPGALQGMMASPGFKEKLKAIFEKNVSFLDRPITRAAMAAGMGASSGELNLLLKGIDQTLAESQQENTVARAVMKTATENTAKATAAEAALLDNQIKGLQSRIAQAKAKGEKVDALQNQLDALLLQKAGLQPKKEITNTPTDTETAKGEKITLASAVKRIQELGGTVTSTTGGKHNDGSLHGQGRAIDIRTRDKTAAQVNDMIASLKAMGFNVRDERVKPAGQAVWGGPHLHVSWAANARYKTGEARQSDPYKEQLQALEEEGRLIAREDGVVNDLISKEKTLMQSYANWLTLANAQGVTQDDPLRKEMDARYNRDAEGLGIRKRIRLNILEQAGLEKRISVAELFGKTGDASETRDALATARTEAGKLQIELLEKADVIATIQVTNVDAKVQADGGLMERTEAAVDAYLTGFKNKRGQDAANADRRRDKLNQYLDFYQSITNSAVTAYNVIAQAGEQSAEREIAARERRLTDAQRLAERGNVEALRLEQDRLERAFRLREEYARRQQAINGLMAFSESTVAIARAAAEGGGIGSFATIAAVIAALASGYAAIESMSGDNMRQFWEGGYTGDGGKYEKAGNVHRGEMVFNQQDVAAAGGWRVLEALRLGLHKPLLPQMQRAEGSPFAMDLRRLEDKMEGVIDALGALSSPGVNIDRDGVAVITLQQQAKHRKRWGSA